MDTTWDAGDVYDDASNRLEKFEFSPTVEFFDPTPAYFSQTHRNGSENPFY